MSGINVLYFESVTVADSSIGLNMPNGAKGALLTLETAQIRWRADGTAPTSAVGHLMEVGDTLNFTSWEVPSANWKSVLRAIRFIRTTATSGVLRVTYFD